MEIQPNRNTHIAIERDIQMHFIINELITMPPKCPLCLYPYTTLNIYDSLNNPYIEHCSNSKCRKIIF